MANVMIDGTSEVETEKTVIYLLVSDAQDCKKDVSNEYQYKDSKHLKQDELQRKTKEANKLCIILLS